MEVRTRIAPSPTGYPHIGTIYQAMFDFVFARKYQGKFILRVEDTDQVRMVEGAEKVVMDSLEWFGLSPDESPEKKGEVGPYRQSERLDIYQRYIQQLINQGDAYYCFCTKERLDEMRKEQEINHQPPMYDKHCRFLPKEEIDQNLKDNKPKVVRMKIPENEKITISDWILGGVEFDSNVLDDIVLLKSDGFPTYHLAVVVDDHLMKITHVFRGQEWLPSAPKHLLLYRFFGWEDNMPQYTHLPVILNTEGGGKLSKRHGHASVDFYKQQGYLPEAILNYLANIVWNHPDGVEIFEVSELGKAFNIPELGDPPGKKQVDIYSQGPKFDLKKLDWVNGEWIRKLPDEDLENRLIGYLTEISGGSLSSTKYENKEALSKLIPLVKERIKKLSDFVLLTDFIFDTPDYEKEDFNKLKVENLKLKVNKVLEKLEGLEHPWKAEEFEVTFRKLAEELDISAAQMFQLLRLVVSGQLVTPPLFECIEIIGEEETLSRVKKVAALV